MTPFNSLWNANFEKNHLEFLAVLESQSQSGLLSSLDLTSELRKAVLYGFLQKVVGAYRTLSLDYLARELKVPREAIVQILVEMITDEKVAGLIDEKAGVFFNEAGNEASRQADKQVQLLQSMTRVVEDCLNRGIRRPQAGLTGL